MRDGNAEPTGMNPQVTAARLPHLIRSLAVVLGLALLASACSDDDGEIDIADPATAEPTTETDATASPTVEPAQTPESTPTEQPIPQPTPTPTATDSPINPLGPLSERPLTFATEGTVEAEIERAHWGQWDAYFAAIGEPPDANSPQLLATTAEPLLSFVQENIQELIDNGWAARPTNEPLPIAEVLSIDVVSSTEASLTMCALDDGLVFEVATGETVNSFLESQLWKITMERNSEVDPWQMSASEVEQRWEGVDGCVQTVEPA